jgi:uncharacterized integral membrane protein
VNYFNTKTEVPLTGVLLEVWPFILMVLLTVVIGMIVIHHHVHTKKYFNKYKESNDDSSEGL